MAKAKKDTQQQTIGFTPVKIDRHATQVTADMVMIEGLDELIPLQDYLENKERELQTLQRQELMLHSEVKAYVSAYLPQRTGTWQEDCRKLSWAYSANGEFAHLKALIVACPTMTLLKPNDLDVTAHHLSHLIRAFLSSVLKLEPISNGRSSCIVYHAQDLEEALQMRIIVWQHLLALRDPSSVAEKPKRLSAIEQVLQNQSTILERLERIEKRLK